MNRRGFTLIEVLVYLVGLTVVLTAAYPAFEKAIRGSSDLRRNADDIVRAVHAGERWRADVRAATGAIRVEEGKLVIPHAHGPVTYEFAAHTVWRNGESFLRDVKSSGMTADRRSRVTVWRWEVELASPRRPPAVRPLFSFEATP